MNTDYLSSKLIQETDFTKEYEFILRKTRDVFKDMVKNGKISHFYAYLLAKYEVDNSFFYSSNLTDYLVEDENGTVLIGEKKYVYPTFLFEIVNNIVSRVIDLRIKNLLKDYECNEEITKKELSELKFGFKLRYIERLRKILSIYRSNTVVVDEHNRMSQRPDKDFDEFEERTIRGGILIACLNFRSLAQNVLASRLES